MPTEDQGMPPAASESDPSDAEAAPPAPGASPGWLGAIRELGPGLISGASDNDPTTVATLAVLGGQTVYALSWLTILLFPMLATIQIISARVGVVAREGLQPVVRKKYGRRSGMLLLAAVLGVNLITIGADLKGGAAALALLLPLPARWFVAPFALVIGVTLIFGSYAAVERVLKYVLLVFVAYVGAAFAAHPDWHAVLHATVVPHIAFTREYIEATLALLGTTLSGYAYVWETIEEAEERPPLTRLGLAQADAGIGMVLAVSIFWFILIGTGATLGVHHEQVQTAEDAARALQPVAGAAASVLFAAGLLASAVLAVPVLAASSAYIVAEEFGWRGSLSDRFREDPAFYAVLAGTLLVGVAVAFLHISAIQLLFWSSIVGGLGTPVSLFFLLRVARDHGVMRRWAIGTLMTGIGWATALLVTATSLYFLYQQIAGAV